MSDMNCSVRCRCTLAAIILSAVAGVAALILTITGIVTVAPVFSWVAFGIAVGYLAVLLLTSVFGNRYTCRCALSTLITLLIGILGTIATAVILLAVGFAATSVVGAIIAGLLTGFFALTITATACLVRYTAECRRQ